jgi:hypothetical protein
MITNTVGIFGPVAAGFLCNWKYLGRRYTMVIGALTSMAFFFAYTAVRTPAQNIAFTCMIYFFVNIYYGTLYAYTPEVSFSEELALNAMTTDASPEFAIRPPSHRQRYRCRLQSCYGIGQCFRGRVLGHLDQRTHLHLCRSLHCHGKISSIIFRAQD